jgi:hypothetical protein
MLNTEYVTKTIRLNRRHHTENPPINQMEMNPVKITLQNPVMPNLHDIFDSTNTHNKPLNNRMHVILPNADFIDLLLQLQLSLTNRIKPAAEPDHRT